VKKLIYFNVHNKKIHRKILAVNVTIKYEEIRVANVGTLLQRKGLRYVPHLCIVPAGTSARVAASEGLSAARA